MAKEKKKKSNRAGLAIYKIGQSVGQAAKDVEEARSSQKDKTMSLKDEFRKQRNKRIRSKG